MKRATRLIERKGRRFSAVHVTLDSHQRVHIAHPLWWIDENGEHPQPFTIIKAQDVAAGIWRANNPDYHARSLAYVRQLDVQGKYLLMIWPYHCLIGTPGHNVHPDLNEALQRWTERHFALINYVAKGSNPFTEHYGALRAEVVDPSDSGTMFNTEFLLTMLQADVVVCIGEALSHCFKTTLEQIAGNVSSDQLKKFVILTDCTSPIAAAPDGPDFPALSASWLKYMQRRGVTLDTSTDFLA